MTQPDTRVLVAGAGIAGLAAALSLAQRGLQILVLEAFETPGEIGAGIQVPPNASHVLAELGLLEAVRSHACKPTNIRLGDAVSGKVVLDLPVNRDADALPLLTVHRARLHRVLYAAAVAHDSIEIRTGLRIVRIVQEDCSVFVTCMQNHDEHVFRARTVIGADGVWSKMREAVSGAARAKPTGRMALRAVVPARTNAEATDICVSAWMAPSSHCVTYPMRNADTRNLVVTVDSVDPGSGWDNRVEAKTVKAVADAFSNTPLATMLAEAAWTSWPLSAVAPTGAWHDGRILLIGDAGHAMEPFGAQGAAMAIEDAFCIARCLAENADPTSPEAAFRMFEAERRARIKAVAKRTEFNRFTYHASGPVRMGRNAVFKLRPTGAFLRDLDWLYDYRA